MRKKIRKALILGSGAIRIGQAGEFDYSGSQAIKALKEEKVRTVVVNPNIATIQTSEHLADRIYFLPVEAGFVEEVIAKEKPDGILLSFGGQTALNTGLALAEAGVLENRGVQVLGTPIETIRMTEDRQLFVNRLGEGGFKIPASRAVTSVEDAVRVAREVGWAPARRGTRSG
jgi:carbamoyl-phosphate synthase large subunit